MAWTVSLAAGVSLVLGGNANGAAEIGQTAALTVDGGRASLQLASSTPRPGPCPRSVLRISVEDHAFPTVR